MVHALMALLWLFMCIPVDARTEKKVRSRHKRNPLKTVLKDTGRLHYNLFARDTFKIAAWTIPFYVQARFLDDKVHSCFYNMWNHKDTNQLPSACRRLASKGVIAPIIGLGSMSFLAKDPEYRTAGYVFLLGMPFVILGKDIIKKWRSDCALRPKCERFCHVHRSYGGLPSGHMAEAMYMTVLFGRRFGIKFGLPLGAFAAYVAGTFISCNRHYLSQMVAGAAWGTMYAYAADKLIDSKLAHKNTMSFGFDLDLQGRPAVALSYRF